MNQSGQGEEGGPLGALLEGLGVLLGLLGGGSWDPLGALLGLSWGPLGSPGGPLWAILEAIDQKRGGPTVPPPLWGPQNRLLGRSWDPLGGFLGALEGLLGPSWRLSIKRWGFLYVGPPLGGHDPREGCQKWPSQ